MKKKVLILGSTGSIGCSTLELIAEHRDKYQIVTLTANNNTKKLAEQAIKFCAQNVVICNKNKYNELKTLLDSDDINVFSGEIDLINLAGLEYDIVIVGIVGIVALKAIMSTIGKSKILGLANKESIICAGDFIINRAKERGTKIIPLDSEHNAIFQIFENKNKNQVNKIVLTASGGPFLNKPLAALKSVTPEEAIKHPNWKMGHKISIDCANMMNKGLEIIEACKLFNLEIDKVNAIIHPQSLVHGMVYYNDGSILAQIAYHDMKTSISTALSYPKRLEFKHHSLDLIKVRSFSFKEINEKRFPLFYLAKEAYKLGQCALIILNVANEIAVDAYLKKKINFLDIVEVIRKALQTIHTTKIVSIEDIIEYSKYIYKQEKKLLEKVKKL